MNNTKVSSVKSPRYEIRIAGAGGQGIILAGIMLAEAGIVQDLYVAQSQSYGPETRGGNSISEVVLSNTEIDFPQSTELDMLIALTQVACDRNLPDMKEDGLVIVDSEAVQRVLWDKSLSIPFGEIARKVGEERAINVAALGSLVPFCPLIDRQALVKAIANRLPSAKLEANLQAFDKALNFARRLKGRLKSAGTTEEFEI
ncbi:MAG TPA: 2-oxoacid:ferredoxin oxidoreductase subunit gamma [Dehalococcoidia bacterium]|nr:2-oxoacid:ferredoxin oxidoreductase subunit gamma [Dehalococcoidia bacterium]